MTVLFPNILNPTDNFSNKRMFEMLAFVEQSFRHSVCELLHRSQHHWQKSKRSCHLINIHCF